MALKRWEDDVLHAFHGRHPLIGIESAEEERMVEGLKALLPKAFPGGTLTQWSGVRGFDPPDKTDSSDPLVALRSIATQPRPGIYVLKDLNGYYGDPRIVRALRETYFALKRSYKTAVILLSPSAEIPEGLEKHVYLVRPVPPPTEELSARMQAIEAQHPEAKLPAEARVQALLALRGLTVDEADHVLHRALSSGARSENILEEVFEEKRAIARKAGFLEFIPVTLDTSAVGGLETAKDWIEKRKKSFTEEALRAGMPIPKGVLIMGVSGCGKSLLAKAIAGLWKVPLFRLDMNLVFSGLYGTPEAAFDRALRTVEAVAPVVMWIDEMEASLNSAKSAGASQAITFSSFLTWLQEKPPLVFVAATANKIELLPAELLRKGRFDEIFFCDLPSEKDRAEILKLQLKLQGADPSKFDIARLAGTTDGQTGAEIEQCVRAARIEADEAGRKMVEDDVWRQAIKLVPLSRTMAEQVKQIRNWAYTRAINASTPPPNS